MNRSLNKINGSQLKTILKVGAAVRKWHKLFKNSKQRMNILKEWIETEHSYISDLEIIKKNIQQPFKQAKLINSQQEKILFPNLESMIILSLSIANCLEAAIANWNPHTTIIGEQIKAHYKYFIIYREYCNNFMKAQEIIKEIKEQPEAKKIEQKLSLDFESYFIKPVQRPPKYQLLLRQYYKALPKDHKDAASIHQAIEKYHEVNQLNNQSMDKQIRANAMIKLDKLYGGTISSRFGRQYLKQFNCSIFGQSCQVHSFDDMIIIIRKGGQQQQQQLWKRIALDSISYILPKPHLKYYQNIAFLCGTDQSVHLQFESLADLDRFIDSIRLTIKSLAEKQRDKQRRYTENLTKVNNNVKFKVTKWIQQLSTTINYKPKLQITVEGTLKPDEALYFIKFKIIHPFRLNQVLMITQKQMQSVEQYFSKEYPGLHFPKVSENREDIGFYDTTKNRTQIIEHRSFLYQECLNYLFRNEEFYSSWEHLANMICLNPSFFSFASSEYLSCRCSLCIGIEENASLDYYISLMTALGKHKQIIKSRITWKRDSEEELSRKMSENTERNDCTAFKQVCSNYYFQIMNHLRKQTLTQKANHLQKMFCLEARLGKMDYTLLQPEQNRKTFKPVSIRVELLSIEQEFIDIRLSEDRYIRQIIEQIGTKNSIDNVFDWGLFLVVDGSEVQMPNDQKVLYFAQKWSADIIRERQVSEQDSFLIQKMKEGWQQLFGKSTTKILFKKWLYLQPESELLWCECNKQRYGFLINEILGRFKSGDLSLNYAQLIDMCALYFLKCHYQKIKFYTADNFPIEELQKMLPECQWYRLKEGGFRMQLFMKISNAFEEISHLASRRNAIELIYKQTLKSFINKDNWTTRKFYLTKYKSSSKLGVAVGVNVRNIIVSNRDSNQVLLMLDLVKAELRVTTFSLFISHDNEQYRYDGLAVLDIKNLIEAYRVYQRLFIAV